MRTFILGTALVAAIATAGCATNPPTIADPTDNGRPQATVTVTETVTAPDGPDGPSESEPAADDRCEAEGLENIGFIFVTSPAPGDEVTDPFEVTGCANTFEATVNWRLLADDGSLMTESFTTATCGTGCVGDFTFEVGFDVDEEMAATLEVYEVSAEDGSDRLVNSIPVLLQP